MLPDRVSNPGPLIYESGILEIESEKKEHLKLNCILPDKESNPFQKGAKQLPVFAKFR